MEDGATRKTVTVGLSDPAAVEAYGYRGIGRPSNYSAELIETILWEVAVSGGNVAKAMRNLREHRDQAGDADAEELPREETVRRWTRYQYRNRYHEIVTQRSRQLEQIVEGNAIERAIAADQIKQDAMKQIQGGMSALDAVEASTVLRNVTAAQKQDVDAALALRRQGQQDSDSRSLSIIADGLVKMGVATYREGEPVDATVVGEEGEETPSLPAGD